MVDHILRSLHVRRIDKDTAPHLVQEGALPDMVPVGMGQDAVQLIPRDPQLLHIPDQGLFAGRRDCGRQTRVHQKAPFFSRDKAEIQLLHSHLLCKYTVNKDPFSSFLQHFTSFSPLPSQLFSSTRRTAP